MYMREECIKQPLYSVEEVTRDTERLDFFQRVVSRFDETRPVTWKDSILHYPGTLPANITFRSCKIRFRFHPLNQRALDHLVKYAYFIYRIGDKDHLIVPIMAMDRFYSYFLLDFSPPAITIRAQHHFRVILEIEKPWKGKPFKVLAALEGLMERPSV